MANAWGSYFSGMKPESENFLQKLRHFVDMEESGEFHVRGAVCVEYSEVVPQSSIGDVDILPQVSTVRDVSEVADVNEVHEVSELIATEAGVQGNVHDGAVHEVAPILDSGDFVIGDGVEITRWICANHQNIERGVAIYPQDTAVLLKMSGDSMMLVYNIGGEGCSHCVVDSLEQAEVMIFEDNESTQELYPGMSEALWCRV